MSRTITYRGLIADGGQDTIPLHTNDGKTGYQVIKFQGMSENPGADNLEAVLKIYKVKQTTVDGSVDFSDGTLVAVMEHHKDNGSPYPVSENVIFDNEIFNQDIYITYNDLLVGVKMNYYIELKQVPLTEDQALVAIVKNLRNEQ